MRPDVPIFQHRVPSLHHGLCILLALGAMLVPGSLCATPCVEAARAEAATPISPASPPDAEELRAMRRWHAAYRERTAEVQRSTARLSHALDRKYPDLDRPCGHLGVALADRGLAAVFPVPDRAADRHLQAAFASLRRAVRACRAERPSELIYRLQQARGAFANAALALRRYGLQP